ncbi:MAG: hypothetical protein HRU11_12335 [Parvularculaceae bacterium]|nr:hypothetical protein [Parvularculaceae bacterium]
MPLPESGQLSLADIAAEFGGDAPHALSEYYGVSSGIPESGLISISDFYGAANVPNVNFPGQWTSGIAGSVWGFSYTGSGAPSFPPSTGGFNTSYIGLGGELWYSGSFLRTITRFDSVVLDVEPNTTYRLNFNKIGVTQDYMGQGVGGCVLQVYRYNVSGSSGFTGVGWGGVTGSIAPYVRTEQTPFYNILQTPNGVSYYQFTTGADCTQMYFRLQVSLTRNQSGTSVLRFSEIYLERV